MGALNADTNVDTIPPCLCDGALPVFLTPLVSLRANARSYACSWSQPR